MKILLSSIIILLFVIIYILIFPEKNIKTNNRQDIYTYKIDSIQNNINLLLSLNEERNTRDSILNTQVTLITNNYKYIYEKTDDTTFNDFIPIIKELLKRHYEIKFERSY